jgi:hypothetical protein
MSVRAYRVISHELEDYPSFNCWHDAKLFDFLLQGKGVHSGLNQDGNGIVEVPVKRLVESLDSKELKLSPDLRDAIKEDVEWADDNLNDHIRYECF